MKKKKEVIILVGNIGTGKSTLAKKYVEKGYVAIARDQLRYAIGDGTYIFNYDYESIIWKTELYLYKKFVDLGINIIVDEVGLTKQMRKRYISYADKEGYKILVIILKNLGKNECVNRRMKNPHGQFNKKLWEDIYDSFDGIYEEPELNEGIYHIFRF